VSDYLLDSSFVIDLLNEIAADEPDVAMRWLEKHERGRLWISPITMAEVIEGADEPEVVRRYLSRFAWQSVHRAHAERVAITQKRRAKRLGENDAWQVAIAETMDAAIVGHDPRAFSGLGARYDDHHQPHRRSR
jgi:predicted nucleic acid-binding protein